MGRHGTVDVKVERLNPESILWNLKEKNAAGSVMVLLLAFLKEEV